MKFLSLILPLLLLSLFVYATFKKVKVYDGFAVGASKGLETVFSILPYLVAVFVFTELFTQSGISQFIINLITPILKLLGIPPEIAPLVLLKPFSGSGSLAILTQIFTDFGVDSYVSRCACAVFGSSETIFYVSAVYFSKSKEKRLTRPILISIASTLISTVFACLICKFI